MRRSVLSDLRAVVNGLVGDELEEQGSSLALPMSLRAEGAASARLCVFAHGLMATDERWRYRDDPSMTYGSQLARDRGVTPVFVSYNTGRHISTNGQELAERLDAMARSWPVPVTEVSLVGHSMGGLVLRSALHHALEAGHGWAEVTRRLVLLGVPNKGSALAHVGHAVEVALSSLPAVAAKRIGGIVGRRSAGIKDLRHGSLLDDDWTHGRRHPVRTPPGLDVFVGAANALGEGDHAVARAVGDVLVSRRSASAGLCAEDHVAVFPATGHVSLAANPLVYAQLLRWWDETPPPPLT